MTSFFFSYHDQIRSPHFFKFHFMTCNSHLIRVRELKRSRTKRVSRMRRLKRQAAPTAKSLDKMFKENAKAYSKMKLNDKYEFA